MKPVISIPISMAAVLAAGAVQAQTWTPRPGASSVDLHRYQVEAHRSEIDRLRAQADQRDVEARLASADARLRRLEAEARRPIGTSSPSSLSVLRPLEVERSARRSAEARRESSGAAVGQIDAWLDRRPD